MSTMDSTNTINKGIGRDRAVARTLSNFNKNEETQGCNDSWAMVCQQIMEDNEKDGINAVSPQCRSLLNVPPASENRRDRLLRDKGKRKPVILLNRKKNTQSSWSDRDPYVQLGMERDMEVKRRTNFNSEVEMIAYVIVVCNADWETIISSHGKNLTWFEEWFFF